MTVKGQYDVVIMGGGLAGLCLSIQLRKSFPDLSILVIEKRKHPVREAAHKVGEATVEIGARYLSKIVDMEWHLKEGHLVKLGLRHFYPAGDNSDVARRVEYGLSEFPDKVHTYQIDRGRYENALLVQARERGIDVVDDARIENFKIEGQGPHTATFKKDGQSKTVTGRWLVDASGPAGLIKRKLGLTKDVPHNVNAVWWRIGQNYELNDWSDNAEWVGRVPHGYRRMSTNHFHNKGYWVWFIPLGSDSTSIGIVADNDIHPIETYNRLDKAMDWLRKHEPVCAKALEEKPEPLLDFLVLRHYAHSCQQVYSTDRWFITGVAGVFHDPLYSPGSDSIGISNTFITEMIRRDIAGEDIAPYVEFYQQLFFGIYEMVLAMFLYQYPLFGNGQVFSCKKVLDATFYWGFACLLFYNNKLIDVEFIKSIQDIVMRFQALHMRLQAFYREWDAVYSPEVSDAFINVFKMTFLKNLHSKLAENYTDEQVRAELLDNLDIMETMVVQVFRMASSTNPGKWQDDDPLAILANTKQITRQDVVEEFNKMIWIDKELAVTV